MDYVASSELLIGASCLYALLLGGAPERLTALIFIAANLATLLILSPLPQRYGSVEVGAFAVDLAMFCALVWIALHADRFWPMPMSALQGVATISHALGLAHTPVIALVYGVLSQIWFIPMTLVLAIATLRHRVRVRTTGAEPAWVRQPPITAPPGISP